MNEIINVIEQVIKNDVVVVEIGLLFIIVAIVVGVFKQTWLIAGINTMSREKKAKMDLDYLGKYFGLFFGIFGGIIILSVFICTYLNIMNYFHRFIPIAIIVFCAFLILYFNVIKRKRIYTASNVEQTGQTEADLRPINISKKILQASIAIVIIAFVGFTTYWGYKEPKVEIDSNAFALKGMYGVNLPFAEITETDTITWDKMPAISIRTNGISLNKVNRGKFKTTDGDNIYMSIYSGVSPVIRIVKQDGSVYYINRKNADETRQIFNTLKNQK